MVKLFFRKVMKRDPSTSSSRAKLFCVSSLKTAAVWILKESLKTEVFGWSAALGRPHYTSSAICLTSVKAIATNGSDLRRVMRGDKKMSAILIERMAQVVAHRLNSFRSQLKALLDAEESQA